MNIFPRTINFNRQTMVSDILGGLSAMLVALPSAVAFGLLVYTSLGPQYAGLAALSGIVGTIALALVTPLLGGSQNLITAPCAPAAAVLGAFVGEQFGLFQTGGSPAFLFLLVSLITIFSGLLQVGFGLSGGGKLIKYIPYTVVSGYLSGVGILIFTKQWPKFLGLSEKFNFLNSFQDFSSWNQTAIIVGLVTMLVMIYSKKITEKIPAPILALTAGLLSYFALGLFSPALMTVANNPLLIGPIGGNGAGAGLLSLFSQRLNAWDQIQLSTLTGLIYTSLTLAVLLSIDTLKTCVVVDALTRSRHDSNRELIGQGLGNLFTGLSGGVAGAGTMGATLVNISSGGKTKISGFMVGVFALLTFFIFSKAIAWIPIASLAGILIVIAYRMVDKSSFKLLAKKSTRLDFFVILAVILTAIFVNLIASSGVGLGLSIILFVREEIRGTVVRKVLFGNTAFSKKRRLPQMMSELETKGAQIMIIELQGNLFFGTIDKLLTEIDSFLKSTKFLVLDFHRVRSMDFTAGHRLEHLAEQLKEKGGRLIFARIPQHLPSGADLRNYLTEMGLTAKHEAIETFADTSDAHEWCEDEILKSIQSPDITEKPLEIKDVQLFSTFSDDSIQHLLQFLRILKFSKNQKIFSVGDKSDELYCIRRGEVKIILPINREFSHHLATFGHGDFFGEMSFLDSKDRSADAICSEDTELFVLSRKDFDVLSETHRRLSSTLFESLAKMMSARLRTTDVELRAQEEN